MLAHFPLPELVPVKRPDASRWLVEIEPDWLVVVFSLPMTRPEASRNWVRLVDPLDLLVSALADVRPLASR